ncbi:MAG: hypothetical protein ABIO46_08160 [Chitinophagales bacterium]
MIIKNILGILLFVALPCFSIAQDAVITNTNMQIYASLNGKPVAWATNMVELRINKATGEFMMQLFIDNIRLALSNPDYTPTGENLGKFLTLRGVLPIYDVLERSSNVMDLKVDLIASFNNIDYHTNFSFSILQLNPNNNKGFSVMTKGSVSIAGLGVTGLQGFDDELGIALSFNGF